VNATLLLAGHFFVNFLAGFVATLASYKSMKPAFFVAKSGFLGYFIRVLKEVCFQ